jgi:hypothetical protein
MRITNTYVTSFHIMMTAMKKMKWAWGWDKKENLFEKVLFQMRRGNKE